MIRTSVSEAKLRKLLFNMHFRAIIHSTVGSSIRRTAAYVRMPCNCNRLSLPQKAAVRLHRLGARTCRILLSKNGHSSAIGGVHDISVIGERSTKGDIVTYRTIKQLTVLRNAPNVASDVYMVKLLYVCIVNANMAFSRLIKP